ncbi:hypothetical protein UWK_01731 [Desulfocapsa sulfexigens DSM 10523]|uniref:Uncharacterized protein n=1 Tax=Desulfocapsa sulfexigens (strain DSM 10523 / SB164P1) TaxID=1167006 RepID=M1NF25_DESSD|nr:hypothetical protein [Desulfocapsa sulfexigens]AGF78289.1 hypothetical protein UWK_01731 [Desulfocapsa sulfexigens DSM 10523]
MISARGNRTKIAVFNDEIYDSSLEHDLITEGFFAVAIKDPKLSDINGHPDFILAPEWIRWLMPTPETSEMWITNLGSSHDRYKLRKKLKTSHAQSGDVRVDIAPLSVDDYKIWYESLYLPEIGEKAGAILFWPAPESLSKKVRVRPSGEVANYFRIFMYHKDGSFIGGSLWFISHPQSILIIAATAFKQKARAKYELSIRGMDESLTFAISHGLKWMSYGTDPNLYGVDFSLGLQMFKASIGMKPVFPRYGSFQLIKVIDKTLSRIDSANSEKPSVLIFAIGGNNVSDRILNYQHLPPLTPKRNFDLLWNRDFGLTPVRFVVHPQTPAVKVPNGMILQDIIL